MNILIWLLLFIWDTLTFNSNSKILLKDIDVLTLTKDKLAAGRRSYPVLQLKCIGGNAEKEFHKVEIVQCLNKGFNGYTYDWKCSTNLPDILKLGKIEIYCEGYTNKDDPYVLIGSCGLEYHLEYTEKYFNDINKKLIDNPIIKNNINIHKNDKLSEKNNNDNGHGVLLFIFVLIMLVLGFFLLLIVINFIFNSNNNNIRRNRIMDDYISSSYYNSQYNANTNKNINMNTNIISSPVQSQSNTNINIIKKDNDFDITRDINNDNINDNIILSSHNNKKEYISTSFGSTKSRENDIIKENINKTNEYVSTSYGTTKKINNNYSLSSYDNTWSFFSSVNDDNKDSYNNSNHISKSFGTIKK